MKRLPSSLLSLLFGACAAFGAGQQAQPTQPQTPAAQPAPIEAYFSPKGGCTDAIVRELKGAKQNVFIQAYSLNSAPIVKALVDAEKRGVHVQVIMDKCLRTDHHGLADQLVAAGIPVFVDDKHPIAHNKIMIIDAATVITGSFDYTKAAEDSLAENIVILRDAAIATKFLTNWQAHVEHASVFEKSASASADQIPKPKHPRQ